MSPKGSGLLQGAFALTPSKLLVVVLASELGLFLGLVSVVLFVSISIRGFVIAGMGLSLIPERLERWANVTIAILAIVYTTYSIIWSC